MFKKQSTSILFVISGPCGAGKTSLTNAWISAEQDLHYVRSTTTRKPRDPSKVKESHYDHVDQDTFLQMIEKGDFAQWIQPAYQEYYGTRRAPIDEAIANNCDMVFDYVPEGFLNIKRLYPQHVVGIFVMAPDIVTLRSRFQNRGTESPEEGEQRHAMALQDFNFVEYHDYHVVNESIEDTVAILRSIRAAEKARLARQEVLDEYRRHARPSLLRYYDAAARN